MATEELDSTGEVGKGEAVEKRVFISIGGPMW